MNYKVEYTSQAIKSLKKFDKHVRKILKDWIEENLINTTNPRRYGKGLTGDKSGHWRYRVGDYRLLILDIEKIFTKFKGCKTLKTINSVVAL